MVINVERNVVNPYATEHEVVYIFLPPNYGNITLRMAYIYMLIHYLKPNAKVV